MKIFTKELLAYAITITLLSLLFRVLLSYFIQSHQIVAVWVLAAGYALSFYFMSYLYAKKERKQHCIGDKGLRFHVTAYIVWNMLSYGWFLFGNPAEEESLSPIVIVTAFWALGLVAHFIGFMLNRDKLISGIPKTKIFD